MISRIKFPKMTEMHLDLCIQSTNHLLETVASIKENIRILEVFLNSGLINEDVNNSKGFPLNNDNFSRSEYGDVLRKRFFHEFGEMTSLPTGKNHFNCCCICRFRQPGAGRDFLNRAESRTSATTISIASNATSSAKRKFSSGPRLIPRLNKTASLRRETVLQRVGRKDSFLK